LPAGNENILENLHPRSAFLTTFIFRAVRASPRNSKS